MDINQQSHMSPPGVYRTKNSWMIINIGLTVDWPQACHINLRVSNWITAYFAAQKTALTDKCLNLQCGVPHGPALGPLNFHYLMQVDVFITLTQRWAVTFNLWMPDRLTVSAAGFRKSWIICNSGLEVMNYDSSYKKMDGPECPHPFNGTN